MHKSATKCNEILGKWYKNKHGASKIMDTLETYHSLFYRKTTLNKGEYEGTQQAWPSTLYDEASRSFWVALCRKQVFFEMTQGEDYSEFVKGIRECLANSFDHGATTKS
jgi:hypothetical protein